MIHFARFDADGRYTMAGQTTPDGLAMEDQDWVYVGEVDISCHYHDRVTGFPVPFPPKPSSAHNKFDYHEKCWTFDTELAKFDVMAKRFSLLAESDWVTTRAVEQGTAVPVAWANYRQALRDIPTQSGYPTHVVWPVAPSN